MPARSVQKKPVKRPAARRPAVRKVRKHTVGGSGAYYVRGRAGGSLKLPYIGHAEAALEAGYSSGTFALKGHGSYLMEKIKHNVFLRGEPPEIRNLKYREGAVVIRHREYIADVISSSVAGQFKVDTYPINPGMSQTFPWLSTIAAGFEEYVITGMVFEFRSTCSDAIASSTNLALGTVGLATQYDPLNPTFNNMQQLLAYEYAQQCKVSENAIHMIECARNQTPVTQLYVRTGSQPANSDIRLYDWGTFSIATSGLQGTSVNLAQCWVSYEILLLKPKLSVQALQGGLSFKAMSTSSVVQNNPLGTAWSYSPANNLAVTLANTGVITFPATAQPVSYLISLNWNNFTAMAAAFSNMSFTNGVRPKIWNNNTLATSYAPQIGLAGTTESMITFVFSTVGQNLVPTVSISNNVLFAGTPYCEITVMETVYYDPAIYGSA